MKRLILLLLISINLFGAEILVRINPDPAQIDTTDPGAYRHGMPVLALPDGHDWGSDELLPKFIRVKVPSLTVTEFEEFFKQKRKSQQDSTIVARREYQVKRQIIAAAIAAGGIVELPNKNSFRAILKQVKTNRSKLFDRGEVAYRNKAHYASVIPSIPRWIAQWVGATQTSVTVNTDNSGSPDYTSLSAAEAGEQKDLVAANEQLTINCSGTTADVTATTFAGWTVDATRLPIIAGNATSGVWDDSKYRLAANANLITIGIGNISICNMQLDKTGNSFQAAIIPTTGVGTVTVDKSIIRYTGTASAEAGIYITNAAMVLKLSNSIIQDYDYSTLQSAGTAYIYNCTIIDANIEGIRQTGGTSVVKNTITQGCTDSYTGTHTGNYNCDDNGDAQMPGANSITATVTFTDAAGGNFALDEGSRGIDEGTNLSSDDPAVTDDAKGTARPQGSGFDMGAFEFVPAASATEENSFGRWSSWTKYKKY